MSYLNELRKAFFWPCLRCHSLIVMIREERKACQFCGKMTPDVDDYDMLRL